VIHLPAALPRQFSAPGGPPRRQAGNLIVLFTDFGLHGPYVGQMKAVLHQMVPGTSIVDLFADAPVGNPRASAYLLTVYAAWFPAGTVFLCVVDPGVGAGRARPSFSRPTAAGMSARVNKRPRLTPPSLGRSIAWFADRRRDPTPINIRSKNEDGSAPTSARLRSKERQPS
jgi:hypothetical protein